jgi:hypothetical protein
MAETRKRGTVPGSGIVAALLMVLAVGPACFDLSALRGEFEPYPESPNLYPASPLPDLVEKDIPDIIPDVALPDMDVSFENLEAFDLAVVEPDHGDIAGDEIVMLIGTGFHDDMEVFFGEVKAGALFVVSSNYATVETPPHWPGPVTVKVVGLGAQQVALEDAFTYVAALTITTVEPTVGSSGGGAPTTVFGTGFVPGCEVLFGGRPAPVTVYGDPFTLQATTPPGHCGNADVVVRCGATGAVFKDGFWFQGTPQVDNWWPKAGPVEGGIEVTLEGRSFTPQMSVLLGDEPVAAFGLTFLAPSLVRFTVPPGEPGPVDLHLITECGEAVIEQAFVYQQTLETGLFEVVGVAPGTVPACLGGFVSVALATLPDIETLIVQVDGTEVQLAGVDEDLAVIDIWIPPGSAGPVDLTVESDGQSSFAAAALERLPGPAIASLSPASGHVSGGTEVAVQGCGFGTDVEVRFGPHVALSPLPISAETIGVTSPPGGSGAVDVQVVSDGQVATLANGFSYLTDNPQLYVLDPAVGSVAGGTWVRFHGAGIPADAKLYIGDEQCYAVQHIDSTLVVARTPPNKTGTYTARVEWAWGEAVLDDAFTCFDPMSKKGGTWGGSIDESSNVTVLDSSTGKGLAAAFVRLGSDPLSPHFGFTDEHGQITFSVPGLTGPLTVTAAKQGYTLYSVAHFDAANVTVYLSPIKLPSSGGSGSYTPAKSYVGGRVFGLEKYAVIPPGDCSKMTVEGVLCDACETDEDCVEEGDDSQVAYCTDIGETGQYCVTSCFVPEDCPAGFRCAKTAFEIAGCIPIGGEKAVRCESSKKSMFGYPPDPGPGGAVNEHDIYFINTVTGELAVVCYGGYIEAVSQQFVPTVMGLHRHVVVLPNQVLKDQDVTLNIPLSREGRIAFHDLPWHPEGIRQPYLLASIKLGKDGYLALPGKPEYNKQSGYFRVSPLPPSMTGPLTGATFSLYASVQSDTTYSLPYAVRMVTGVESLFGDGLIITDETSSEHLYPTLTGNVVGLAYRSSDSLYVASDHGELLHYDGIHWTPVGVPDAKQGFTVLVEDNLGGIWLGGKKGGLWHFNGTGWIAIDLPYPWPIVDLWAAAGKAVVAYSSLLAIVGDYGIEKTIVVPTQHQVKAIWAADFERFYVITNPSSLWEQAGSDWNLLLTLPDREFVALDGQSADQFWVAATPGRLLHFEDDSYVAYELEPSTRLASVQVAADGTVVAGAADGQLYMRHPGGDFNHITTGTLQEFRTIDYLPGSGRVAAAGAQAYHLGPFMSYPRVLMPENEQVFDFSSIQWDYWTQGAEADYVYMTLSSKDGYSFWTLMVDGAVKEVTLPPLVQELGLNLMPEGAKRMNLTANLNPLFSIDNYTLNDLSMYDKISWSVDLVNFE